MIDFIEIVVEINKRLFESELCIQTWGNASAVDRSGNLIYIKPSGVPFSEINSTNIVKVTLDGLYEGEYRPSVDTPIHLELYGSFLEIGGIVHTHSTFATAFAQAGSAIPCLGTTHADYFKGPIPIVPGPPIDEISEEYEKKVGSEVITLFRENNLDPLEVPAALLANHGVIVWGSTIEEAFENAIVLEEIAKIAHSTILLGEALNLRVKGIDTHLVEKHYDRKHSPRRYYGQI